MIYLTLESKSGRKVLGEKVIDGDDHAIHVDSFDWSMSARTRAIEERDEIELRAEHVTISRTYDRASGGLSRMAASREGFVTATLTMLGGVLIGQESRNVKMLEVVLHDGHVENISLRAAGAGNAIAIGEEITLSFRKSDIRYHPYDPARRVRSGAMVFNLDLGDRRSGS